MSIFDRRKEIADEIAAGLASVPGDPIPIEPYLQSITAPFSGWLEIDQADLEGCVFGGEIRLTIECVILVAADRGDFERMHDQLVVPLINAVSQAGGRNVTVQPRTETLNSTTFYSLSARFVTEAPTT